MRDAWTADDALTAEILLHTLAVRAQRMERIGSRPRPRIIDRIRKGKFNMTDTTPPKRTGLMRAVGAVNRGNEIDREMGDLADRVERNNRRAIELAMRGHKNEAAKELMQQQMAREQALDDLEKAMGGNFPPEGQESPNESNDALRKALLDAKRPAISTSSDQGAKEEPKPDGTTFPQT